MPASEAEAKLLYEVAKESHINRAVEIGCLFGKSTLAILKGMKEKFNSNFTLYCIDPFLYIHPQKGYPAPEFFKNIYEAGFHENVIAYVGLSSLAHSVIGTQKYGFAYIDGDHQILSVLSDLLMCATRTKKIVLHDYYSPTHQDVNNAVDYFKQHSKWEETVKAEMSVVIEGDYILEPTIYPK